MNLVMMCTSLGREDRYNQELRLAGYAETFFHRAYPEGKVYLATNDQSKVDRAYVPKIEIIEFPFQKFPLAISRQVFYQKFLLDDRFQGDTLFTGSDVVLNRKLETLDKRITYTYRYHPAMPYCSDFFYVPRVRRIEAAEMLTKIIEIMSWMPESIRASWADQIAIASVLGMLPNDSFDGRPENQAPLRPEIRLLNADTYLFTPNDAFPSNRAEFSGLNKINARGESELLALCGPKHVLHFKGNRKNMMKTYCSAIARIDGHFEELN